jgi:hypothetical protein
VTGAAPASAGLSNDRLCRDFYTGDQHGRLSVCAVVWFSDVDATYRAVVQMHTYILVNGFWTDVTSQSITINGASLYAAVQNSNTVQDSFSFGNDANATFGTDTCRVNGPSGPLACSVPNTYRADFYSKAATRFYSNVRYKIQVNKVSWRDSLGQAHVVSPSVFSFPDTLPFIYEHVR